ncbi:MAG: thiamine diphosphokinase [Candidatus Thermoplasmatota archaeon]|jgi:thiamine pyrophosphokinase|nr:thiamine diphosphokinase [Candidatus Thermoplasmatota archaeon]
MKTEKGLVVGNRPLSSKVIELAKNSLVVAADAGADRLLKFNIVPDWIIGDLDSISEKAITKLEDWTITNKDIQKTDLEKAVDYAFEKGVKEIVIVGWEGGRIDHTLAALGMAFDPRIKLIDDKFTVYCVDGEKRIKGKENTLFSLIAMPEARVSVNGARWNLEHEKLKIGGRGIHNEIGPSGEVTIECHSGNLLLIEGDFVLPHD